MNLKAFGLALVLALAGSFAFSQGDISNQGTVRSVICATTTITDAGTCYARGQVVGTATNDAATAGNIGEVITAAAVGNAVALTTGTAANMTSISVTAGDWNVFGSCIITPATVTSYNVCSVSFVSATTPSVNDGQITQLTYAGLSGVQQVTPTPTVRVLLSATTTVYLVQQAAFASTATGGGTITARRAR